VEQAVNAALDSACQEAEALLRARFGDVTLAMLSADFHARRRARLETTSHASRLAWTHKG
jgi:hypothetical protein